MIRDKEIATLFKAESEEHLARLDELLLHLEAEPRDRAALEEVFREAHSLKGSARMVGERGIEALAHRFEDALNLARQASSAPSPELFARLARHLDAKRKLVAEAVSGVPSGVDIPAVLAEFEALRSGTTATGRGGGPVRKPEGASVPAAVPLAAVPPADAEVASRTAAAIEQGPLRQAAETVAEPEAWAALSRPGASPNAGTASPAQLSGFRISTVRVAPERLDALMTHAGELSATKLRIERRLMQIEELFSYWEEWSREVSTGPGRKGGRNGHGSVDGGMWQRHVDRLQRLGELLTHLKSVADEDTARLHYVSGELEHGIHSLRLLPLSTVFSLFPRMVHDLARQQQKEIELITEGGDTAADKRVLEDIKDPLMHLIRNAVDHGIESPAERQRQGKPSGGTIRLKGYQTASNIVIEVLDDGRGLNLDHLRAAAVRRHLRREEDVAALTPAEVEELIFTSGFSTSPMVTDLSGRGVGLDVVRRNVETLKGTIQVESSPGAGCTMRIQLPVTLAAARVLIAQVDGWPYALPVEAVVGIRLVAPDTVFSIEGRDTIEIDRVPLSVVELSRLLELRAKGTTPSSVGGANQKTFGSELRPCIIISTDHERLGLFVDALVDEQEVVLKPLGPLLARVRNVSGTTILGTGEVCTVLNPQDLIKSARKRGTARAVREAAKGPPKKRLVLLAEDSITTRTQEKRILESAGYEVVTAVDGLDAFNKLHTRPFEAVVSDVQMPNLDGLSLTEKIRQDRRCKDLPVILVTSLSSEADKKRGIEVGATAYITKPAFDQSILLETLARLT